MSTLHRRFVNQRERQDISISKFVRMHTRLWSYNHTGNHHFVFFHRQLLLVTGKLNLTVLWWFVNFADDWKPFALSFKARTRALMFVYLWSRKKPWFLVFSSWFSCRCSFGSLCICAEDRVSQFCSVSNLVRARRRFDTYNHARRANKCPRYIGGSRICVDDKFYWFVHLRRRQILLSFETHAHVQKYWYV